LTRKQETVINSVQLMIYARDLSDSHAKLEAQIELRNKLSRYVGDNLVEKLKNNLTFENEKKELTILFVDIRSFTSISEKLTAEEVVAMLNEYFDAVVDIILDNNGHLDKFVGDEIMAVFGVLPSRNHAARDAVLSALAMQQKTEEFMKIRTEQDRQTFQVGIGINTGEVIVGNVGSKNRMDYTVIGDVVNTAARLQQSARGGEIIIGEKTFRQTRKDFTFLDRGPISLKNKAQTVCCYQVIAPEISNLA
jgi:adenylate cyclase